VSSNVSPNFVDPEEYITDDVTYVMKSSSAVIAPLTFNEPVISTSLVADHIDPVCANIESPDEPLEPLEPELPDVPLDPDVPDDPLLPLEPDEPDVPLEPELPDVPEEPLDPLEPDVPEDPLLPLVPDVPDVIELKLTPLTVIPPVKLPDPDTIMSSLNTTLLPPELVILLPSCI
jgi:hypothetical protein